VIDLFSVSDLNQRTAELPHPEEDTWETVKGGKGRQEEREGIFKVLTSSSLPGCLAVLTGAAGWVGELRGERLKTREEALDHLPDRSLLLDCHRERER